MPSSLITQVLSVSASEKRATKFALQPPSILPAVIGSVTQLAPAALHNLVALRSPFTVIIPGILKFHASLSVITTYHVLELFVFVLH